MSDVMPVEKLAPKNSRFFDAPLGLIAAAAVHVALFFALFYVFQWNTDSETVYAELWAPEDASGRNVQGQSSETTDEMPPEPEMNQAPELAAKEEPLPTPEEQPVPEPQPTPAPEPVKTAPPPAVKKPEPEPEPDSGPTAEELAREAEIKLAQQRAEEARLAKEKAEAEAAKRLAQEEARREAERLAEEKRLEEERLAEEKRLEEERLAEEKRLAEERRLAEEKRIAEEKARKEEAARQKRIAQEKARQARIAEQMRQAELARITGARTVETGRVGSTKGDPSAVRQNLRGSLTAAYTARVIACIRPHIAYNVPPNAQRGRNVATFEVNLLPNGELAGKTMVKSSGLAAFDAAVDRAITRCRQFPRPSDGSPIPRRMQILFDPVDSK